MPELKEKPLKKVGKVAVIIPTKGKLDLLFNCINSFYKYSSQNDFTIFIADTGSTEDEIDQIQNIINNHENIKLFAIFIFGLFIILWLDR